MACRNCGVNRIHAAQPLGAANPARRDASVSEVKKGCQLGTAQPIARDELKRGEKNEQSENYTGIRLSHWSTHLAFHSLILAYATNPRICWRWACICRGYVGHVEASSDSRTQT